MDPVRRADPLVRAWTRLDEVVRSVYVASRRFPGEEVSDLRRKVRGAAVAAALCLAVGADGNGRPGASDLAGSRRSLCELRYFLYLSRRLGLLDGTGFRRLGARIESAREALDRIEALGLSRERLSGRPPIREALE